MLYLSGIIIAFFLLALLLTKKYKSTGDFILMVWISIAGFHLLTFYLMLTGQYVVFPTIITLGFALPLAHGPFLYLYTCSQTSGEQFRTKHLIHFLPVVLSWLLFARFYFMNFEQKVEVFRLKGQGFENAFLINISAIYLSGITYIVLALMQLVNYRKSLVHQFSNTEKINFNWLLYLIIWLALIWLVIIVVKEDEWIFGAAALFIIWLGYFGIRQVQVFAPPHTGKQPSSLPVSELENDLIRDTQQDVNRTDTVFPGPVANSGKYQKSSLTEEDVSVIHKQLLDLLESEKPYRNVDLTLTDLSQMLDVQPNHLSQVINSKENRNFYDLINEKRVEEFIRLLSKPTSKNYSLLGLAFESGFNSKASFNRNFKKYMGLSPRDYQKQQEVH